MIPLTACGTAYAGEQPAPDSQSLHRTQASADDQSTTGAQSSAGGQSAPGTQTSPNDPTSDAGVNPIPDQAADVTAADKAIPTDRNGDPIDLSATGSRDNTPSVLSPAADGTVTYGTSNVTIDASHMADGYLSIAYHGTSPKVKIQITPPNGNTYTYDVTTPGSYEVFPLTCWSGSYRVGIYTNVVDNKYAAEYETSLDVSLDNEFAPFLYPNQLVWFTKDSAAVAAAQEVCKPANDDFDAISLIYDYVIHHMTYDWEKAEHVQSGYIPDVDEVLRTGKGICFDYAALLASMLRSQRIPTRMEIGYAGTAYHAWISTYIEEVGWVNGIIKFDGRNWQLMDPTLATTQSEDAYKDYIQAGDNYRTIYLY
ncbi:Transglutaminase-like superfamily protein [Lachnospiraceae bacterium NK3A20]|nr:Transglutaminase-like superfamily protein [Lachnospiraceae bacterium NK3A20]